MRVVLKDRKMFHRIMSISEFRPEIYLAVQQNGDAMSMFATEDMAHFDKTNYKKATFRYSYKTKNGTPVYIEEA